MKTRGNLLRPCFYKITFAFILCLSLTQALSAFEQTYDYPFYAKSVSAEDGDNVMMVLNQGMVSLQKRIDMIRRARQTIDVEYFIYRVDDAGRILMSELIKKAREGVKVRVLLDKSITVIRFDEYYADELRQYGIEVSYYNRALDPSTAQYRNHRKMIAIDRHEAIVGGRNIALRYFDMDPKFNFDDRDLWVQGPIVEAINASFDAFWNSNRTQRAVVPHVPEFSRLHRSQDRRNTARLQNHRKRQQEAKKFLTEDQGLRELKALIESKTRDALDQKSKHVCPEAVFLTDKPTGNFLSRYRSAYKENERVLNRVLKEKIRQANESVFIDSSYFIANKEFTEILEELLDRDVSVSVLTNSLGSTDVIYVAAVFYKRVFDWIGKGMRTFVHSSNYQTQMVLNEKVRNARSGMHTKTFIIDDQDFTIGSYNVDNRSDFYNAEMTVFCKGSPELVSIVRENIDYRLTNSYELHADKSAIDHKSMAADIYGHAKKSMVNLMKSITIPSILLEFLL